MINVSLMYQYPGLSSPVTLMTSSEELFCPHEPDSHPCGFNAVILGESHNAVSVNYKTCAIIVGKHDHQKGKKGRVRDVG